MSLSRLTAGCFNVIEEAKIAFVLGLPSLNPILSNELEALRWGDYGFLSHEERSYFPVWLMGPTFRQHYDAPFVKLRIPPIWVHSYNRHGPEGFVIIEFYHDLAHVCSPGVSINFHHPSAWSCPKGLVDDVVNSQKELSLE